MAKRAALPPKASPQAALRLYASQALEGDISQSLGLAHYSYRFAQTRFCAMLAANGRPAAPLRMPEYYASAAAMPEPSDGPALHLIFRSTEQIRLLKHARNVCCFAWEFEVLKNDTVASEHPFLNQVRMLSLCEEIWTPSHYALAVLRRYGLNQARRIPAPVDPPAGGRASLAQAIAGLGGLATVPLRVSFALPQHRRGAWCAQGRASLATWLDRRQRRTGPATIYLSILNPEDVRKNLDSLLRGFDLFQRAHPQAVLIVKALTARSRHSLTEIVADLVRYKLPAGTVLENESIVFINDYLGDADMTLLYSLADFYLCTSLAEGQNLPLLEAMAVGTIPVTTAVTAMADYIDEHCAFVIPTRRVLNDNIDMAAMIARRPFHVALCSPRDVCTTLQAAQAARPAARAARAARAIQVVREKFGQAAVWPLVRARLEHAAQ